MSRKTALSMSHQTRLHQGAGPQVQQHSLCISALQHISVPTRKSQNLGSTQAILDRK